ncbi:MAG: DUF3847 domain-containing protein [Oscillospiraceae bacterium]|jgi:hypothetical protein|nr:DUF3847 domain-containing protein [Oscillospiraceae bacterium]
MANRRTLDEQLEAALEERKKKNDRVNTLLGRQRTRDNKARTHRLCKRGGLVEKLLPDLAKLSDEQFDTFVDKTLLTPHTKRVLDNLLPSLPADEANGGADTAQGGNAHSGNGTPQTG